MLEYDLYSDGFLLLSGHRCNVIEGRDSKPSSSMIDELSLMTENRHFMIAGKYESVLIPTLILEDHFHVTRG